MSYHDAILPMIIDSFAGGGGASTGIEAALGRSPDVAINHSGAALALHAANHPETIHLNSNIWDVRPREVTQGRPVGLLWASPDCKHFSKAKGGAPRDRNIRDLAWVIVDWAEQVKPDVILMENVEEFTTWGPVGEDGQPIKEFEGLTFADWKARLRKAGYKLDHRELRACDYGAPTIRKRFFLIARRDGRPIVWPKQTHGDQKSAAVRKGKLLPWRTAAECIDWSLPCPSIFDTKDQIWADHALRAVRPLKPNTLARIARGIHRYVIEADRPFIVNLTHGGRIEDPGEPIRTITGAHRGEKAIICPEIIRLPAKSGSDGWLTKRGQEMPSGGSRLPPQSRLNGEPCCPRQPGEAPGIWSGGWRYAPAGAAVSDITAPFITRFNGGAAPLGLITPYLASIAHGYSGGRREYPLTDPLGTVTVGGIQHALVAPILSQMYGSGGGRGDPDHPAPTVTACGQHRALVAPVLTYAQQGGGNRPITAPHHTICASRKDQNSLIAATMIQTGYGERLGQAPRALDLHTPLGTVVAGGVKHAPIAAYLAQHNNDSRRAGGVNPGRPADAPVSTICASGSQQNVVAAWFAKYYGTGDGACHDAPCHTVTVRDRFAHMQADLAAPPFGPEHEAKARAVAQLLRDHGLWDDREFVTLVIDGAQFVVVDIGMRMLTPRELFRAQGFPDDYVIEGVWDAGSGWENLGHNGGPTFTPFPKDVQVSCCGNSVCPPLAEALVRANCGHLMADHRHERSTA